MSRKAKGILLVSAAIAAFSVFVTWFVGSRPAPRLDVTPVTKNAATLNEADIEKLLAFGQFRTFRHVRQVPVAVKESFSNFTGLPFDLADPSEEISSDLMIPGKSSRRLVFLGLSADSAILIYKQVGFVGTCHAVVFWYGEEGRGWGASLPGIPKNMDGFRAIFSQRRFQSWEHHPVA
jgi:hypothetical protein